MNVMVLPKGAKGRSKIVQCVHDKFISKRGNGIIRNKWCLKVKKDKLDACYSKVLDKKYDLTEYFWVPCDFDSDID